MPDSKGTEGRLKKTEIKSHFALFKNLNIIFIPQRSVCLELRAEKIHCCPQPQEEGLPHSDWVWASWCVPPSDCFDRNKQQFRKKPTEESPNSLRKHIDLCQCKKMPA